MEGGSSLIRDALRDFAEAVTVKSSARVQGAPEDQLRGPFEYLMAGAADA